MRTSERDAVGGACPDVRVPSLRLATRLPLSVLVLFSILVSAGAAVAEPAWVRAEIRLNVRAGAGTQFKILDVVSTGDGVEILQRGDGWTKIRFEDKEGWIPEGYLNPEPPETVRLERAETEAATLRAQVEELRVTSDELRSTNEELAGRDDEQRDKIESLTLENYELRAGARYPEMITGASIFAAGMLIGAWVYRYANRRPASRIRL